MRAEKRAKEPKVTGAPSCFLAFFSREIQIKITDWGVYSPAAWLAKPWYCLWTQRANWPIAEQGWTRLAKEGNGGDWTWWTWWLVFHKLLLISWDSHNTAAISGILHKMVRHRENTWRAAGACRKMPRWCQRSKVKGSEWAGRPQRQTTATGAQITTVAPNVNLIKWPVRAQFLSCRLMLYVWFLVAGCIFSFFFCTVCLHLHWKVDSYLCLHLLQNNQQVVSNPGKMAAYKLDASHLRPESSLTTAVFLSFIFDLFFYYGTKL